MSATQFGQMAAATRIVFGQMWLPICPREGEDYLTQVDSGHPRVLARVEKKVVI